MDHISPDDLEQIYSFAIDLGKKAGSILLKGAQSRIGGESRPNTDNKQLQLVEKENQVDIVTETDEGAET
jgi:myo-inositol-1(or 4)-monophosphatase